MKSIDWNPKHWSPKRRRSALVALVLGLLAYPVLGTLALWTGFVEWVIRSEDVKVELKNPSYTIWPGRVHLKHVKIYVNGDTQFILEGSDLLTNFSLFGFLRHRVHVATLAAHDVRYQMRVQIGNQSTGAIGEPFIKSLRASANVGVGVGVAGHLELATPAERPRRLFWAPAAACALECTEEAASVTRCKRRSSKRVQEPPEIALLGLC